MKKTTAMGKLDDYLHADDPMVRQRAECWKMAIGLQRMYGLQTSVQLSKTAIRHIRGGLSAISVADVRDVLEKYYSVPKFLRWASAARADEGDYAAQATACVLRDSSFRFSRTSLGGLHRALFRNILKSAGIYRVQPIVRREWVLGEATLEFDHLPVSAELAEAMWREETFDYAGLSPEDTARHVARFLAALWEIHPFKRGNSLAIAVLAFKYLRTRGFDPDPMVFAGHAWYFRNALVRASRGLPEKNVLPTTEYLERFLLNLLFGAKNDLQSRHMLVGREIPFVEPMTMDQRNDLVHNMKRISMALDGEMTQDELMKALRARDRNRNHFRRDILFPALKQGFVESVVPGDISPTARYRLGPWGLSWKYGP